jgi:anti-sigma factor RsiW
MSCSSDDLEALARGELDPARAAEVEAHATRCAACKHELTWLRAERLLLDGRRARQAQLAPSLWLGVEERVAAQPVRSFPAWNARQRYLALAAAGMAIAFGAATLRHFITGGAHRTVVAHHADDGDDSDSVLADAESEYREAAEQLEHEYRERRDQLPRSLAARTDRALAEAREQIALARDDARSVDGKMRLLDGYADYVHSLQTVVYEVNPEVNR